ncbi:MAG: hypothetical protein K0Q65_1424 [Clostridia bacterium]|nr:hypothetical protein [Clostridia bacterium]
MVHTAFGAVADTCRVANIELCNASKEKRTAEAISSYEYDFFYYWIAHILVNKIKALIHLRIRAKNVQSITIC